MLSQIRHTDQQHDRTARQRASGIVFVGASLALRAAVVSVEGGYLSVLPSMLAIGLGMDLSITPSTETITTALPRKRQDVASALNHVTRKVGTALGVARLGAVLSAGYRDAIDSQLDGLPGGAAARGGVANALEAADAAGPRAHSLVRIAQESAPRVRCRSTRRSLPSRPGRLYRPTLVIRVVSLSE